MRFWLKLGFVSFGGPAGQIAIMHTELVERRRWISERRFLHALNFCMVLPGPEAQQLATYLGWLLHRTWGGLAAGAAVRAAVAGDPDRARPGSTSRFGDVPLVAGLFYGIKPAVVAIVLHAAWRIGGACAEATARCGRSRPPRSSRSSPSTCRSRRSCWARRCSA
ncbi:MAG: chromate transporter [Candidatus Moduliflexus flocculans]|nr:chromate transporter [Candidatus Moduliflexus flocculans]